MKIGSSHNILCRKNSVTREICKPMENTRHRREREMQHAANRTYMSIGRFLDVRVLDDVTVEMNQTEEVEAERRSETTQHPARHIISYSRLLPKTDKLLQMLRRHDIQAV